MLLQMSVKGSTCGIQLSTQLRAGEVVCSVITTILGMRNCSFELSQTAKGGTLEISPMLEMAMLCCVSRQLRAAVSNLEDLGEDQ